MRPSRASRGGNVISHIESCTWCSHTARGRVAAHTGEKNGMPFQISTSASLAPCQPIISLNAARGKHEVAAGLADDPIAVAPADLRRAGRVRRPHRHLDAGLAPQRGDPRRVQLRAAGLGVVDVAPREDRDPPQPRGRGDVAELGDIVGAGAGTGRNRSRKGPPQARRDNEDGAGV